MRWNHCPKISMSSTIKPVGNVMNPDRKDGNQKIIRILSSEVCRWEKMTKDALICELIEEKRHFLETELEYGNEDYLDELLEECQDGL